MVVAQPDNAALRQAVDAVLARYAGTLDAELAQRAVEYRGLSARLEVARAAVQPLPKIPSEKPQCDRRFVDIIEVGAGG